MPSPRSAAMRRLVTFCSLAGLTRQKQKGDVAMKNTIELNETNFDQEVLKAPGVVLVDFYAPWCGPCRMLAPLLEQLADEFAGRVKIVKVNVDDAPELAMRYGITGVPTLILFRSGLILDTWVGLPSPRALKSRLDELAPQPVQAVAHTNSSQ
jgi:thioredoxin